MNTTDNYILNQEDLDTEFLTNHNINEIIETIHNKSSDPYTSRVLTLTEKGQIKSEMNSSRGWAAYPPLSDPPKPALDQVEYYSYNQDGHLIEKRAFNKKDNKAISVSTNYYLEGLLVENEKKILLPSQGTSMIQKKLSYNHNKCLVGKQINF